MAQNNLQQAFDLAMQHHQAGRLAEAEKLYRQVLAQQPAHFDALHLLGVLAHQVGRNDVAMDLIRRAIALCPNVPQYYLNLGNALKGQGQLDDAIVAYRRAIALLPTLAQAHFNLGIVLRQQGRLTEAVAAFGQEIALDPSDAQAHSHLGVTLRAINDLDGAIAEYHRAIALNPNLAEVYNNLGAALSDKGQLDDAIEAYRKAIALNPKFAEAHSNLGVALNDKGQFDEAIAAYREATALNPAYAQAHGNLGNALKEIGRLNEAITAYRRAIALMPGYATAHSNLLLAMHYHPDCDPESIAEEHRRWNWQYAKPLERFIQPQLNNRNPDRKLRMGYVSQDFREHSVNRFLLPLFAAHDHESFEICAYAQVSDPDEITAKLKSHCDTWRSTVGLSDQRVAEMIRQDQIDILVDLAGHTADNRLLVFAQKPAPVQVTWLGYPDTTGLTTIDYRFTDAIADPPGLSDRFCSEQLIRLPQTNWCFQPPEASPPVNDLPAIANHYVTFGCFNNFAKVNELFLKQWAKMLLATPGSKLLLKAKPLACASARQFVRQVMSEAGIDPARFELIGFLPAAEYLSAYNRIDIALDTYPYHGTTTTCEALWMGVPVISLAGATHVSRVGASLLANIGLPDLIAQTPEEYVKIAVELANDLPWLQQLRSTLRRRMELSPLMDAIQFARNVEAVHRRMWLTWSQTDSSTTSPFSRR